VLFGFEIQSTIIFNKTEQYFEDITGLTYAKFHTNFSKRVNVWMNSDLMDLNI